MKTLYIIRHAKSSWKDLTLNDFDRPLNKRGKLNAPLMGDILKDKNIVPNMIISSPAKRAKTTAKIIADKINFSKSIIFDKNIYEASIHNLHRIITKVDDENNILFLFGHNPSLNMLVESFVDFDENIPTCGVVEIEFNCDKWMDISQKNAKLISFDYPKRHNTKMEM
ncbi:MAG: histidine phosphatase family protein [Arcobacteraceae bacterium]|nr:histidine phosphatase family protein [Arcobacteraceae bacterium]